MIRILWPAFIPLVAFGIFLLWRKKLIAAGHDVPAVEGARFWSIIASIVMALVMLGVIGFSQQRNADSAVYTPAQLNDDGSFDRGGVQ